jgi:hypothetical protein
MFDLEYCALGWKSLVYVVTLGEISAVFRPEVECTNPSFELLGMRQSLSLLEPISSDGNQSILSLRLRIPMRW